MAKDAKGHGSNARGSGGMTPVQQENQPFKSSLPGPHYLDPNDPRGAHAQGVAQVGQPPSPNLKNLNSQYNRNETMNNHSGNIALLAKNFGTADEHSKAQEIIAGRKKLGWLPDSTPNVPNVRDWQYGIHQKYINKLKG